MPLFLVLLSVYSIIQSLEWPILFATSALFVTFISRSTSKQGKESNNTETNVSRSSEESETNICRSSGADSVVRPCKGIGPKTQVLDPNHNFDDETIQLLESIPLKNNPNYDSANIQQVLRNAFAKKVQEQKKMALMWRLQRLCKN